MHRAEVGLCPFATPLCMLAQLLQTTTTATTTTATTTTTTTTTTKFQFLAGIIKKNVISFRGAVKCSNLQQ